MSYHYFRSSIIQKLPPESPRQLLSTLFFAMPFLNSFKCKTLVLPLTLFSSIQWKKISPNFHKSSEISELFPFHPAIQLVSENSLSSFVNMEWKTLIIPLRCQVNCQDNLFSSCQDNFPSFFLLKYPTVPPICHIYVYIYICPIYTLYAPPDTILFITQPTLSLSIGFLAHSHPLSCYNSHSEFI